MTIDLEHLKELLASATQIYLYPGYWVTRDGHVLSSGTNWRGQPVRILVAHPDADGYLRVRLQNHTGRHGVSVHRLVAETFLPPRPSPLHEIRHLNGNPADNRVRNLAWGTKSDNAQDRKHHGRDHESNVTHCPKGHAYADDNLRVRAKGWRFCRECRRAYERDLWRRKHGVKPEAYRIA